jgi:hypothetical protein
MQESSRSAAKEWLDIVQAIFTIGAIIAAAIWFIDQQSLKPQVKLEQTITKRAVAGQPGYWLTAVDVRATNIGKVKVFLTGGTLSLTQINPVPGEDLTTTSLKDLELDPGEADQAIFVTFVVPDYIHTVQATSSYQVPKDKGYFWELVSALDLDDGKPDKTVAVSH